MFAAGRRFWQSLDDVGKRRRHGSLSTWAGRWGSGWPITAQPTRLPLTRFAVLLDQPGWNSGPLLLGWRAGTGGQVNVAEHRPLADAKGGRDLGHGQAPLPQLPRTS